MGGAFALLLLLPLDRDEGFVGRLKAGHLSRLPPRLFRPQRPHSLRPG
jgi:hypothetical protein